MFDFSKVLIKLPNCDYILHTIFDLSENKFKIYLHLCLNKILVQRFLRHTCKTLFTRN